MRYTKHTRSPLEGEPKSHAEAKAKMGDSVGGAALPPPTEPAALRLQVPAPPQGGSKGRAL